MIGPIDYDSLTEPQQKKFRETQALRERNAARVKGIEDHGVVLDLGPARIDHLLSALLDMDVLTIDQILEVNKAWELELRRQTKEIFAKIERAQEEARKERARPKLIIPGR